MACIDARTDAVVVRIVYDGPPTSGKTTSLRRLAAGLSGSSVFTPQEHDGRTLYFDWLEYVGGRFEGRQIRCQLVSVPGQKALAGRRQVLLDSADVVVFVADTTASAIDESIRQLESLRDGLTAVEPPVGVVLQANKRDVPSAVSLEPLRGHGLGIVESVASSGDGVRETFIFAVRLALDRVREQMRLGTLKSIDLADDVAGDVLKQMKTVPIEAPLQLLAELTSVRRAEGTVLPDVSLPGGAIWPPLQGRVSLQEASSAGVAAPRELSPGEWLAESSSGWRFHSAATNVFDDVDSARSALIRWAQLHASCGAVLSPHRCIAMVVDPDGRHRLWQVVRSERSLWHESIDVDEARAACRAAAERWAGAPVRLPCTLETVGRVDGVPTFVSLFPAQASMPGPQNGS